MSQPTSPPPAGWYPDPQGDRADRWWNGLAWTATTRPWSSAPPASVLPPAAAGYAPSPVVTPYEQANTVPPFQAVAPYRPGHAAVQLPYAVAPYRPGHAAVQLPYAVAAPVWTPPVRTMADAVRAVLRRYATFEGRAGRAEFWYWTLFNVLVSFAAVMLMMVSFLFAIGAVFGILLYVALIGWSLAVLVPSLAVSVRRLRDAGYHWALIFLALVPFGSIVLLVLHCQPSKAA